jgi:hypothetical protein
MGEFQKVLVVDDGARDTEHALSAELAELGFASVTTSLEATDHVLEMIPPPAAILLQLPRRGQSANCRKFIELAERLKAKKDISGIPIVLMEPRLGASGGGFASLLEDELGVGALNKPDL